MTRPRRFCDGIRRRSFLQAGAASLFGAAWSLPSLMAGQSGSGATDRSVIIVFLKGGLSTIDSWDMKPNAPAEFRGVFNPIDTNVPGIQLGEHLPRCAQQADKFSLIRSFTHNDSNHGPADHYMLTGYHPVAGFNAGLTPNNQRPAHGSIIARKLGPRRSVPAYVCLPDLHPSAGSSYLGANYAPFVINGDPNDPGFRVRDIVPPAGISSTRTQARTELLGKVDRFAQQTAANSKAGTVSAFRTKAFELMTSSATRAAFSIHNESDKLRDEYGRTSLGQSCLMARRLVEAGVRCVTINHVDWDTHENNFVTLKRDLLPHLDAAMATLFRDLSDRGLLERTLVVVTGEFGRTPRINKNAGRDHWGPGFTVAVGGGGLKGGRIVGRSDARAERPADDPYGPEDLAATMHRQLGINPQDEFHTPEGRPIKIVNEGRMIRELV